MELKPYYSAIVIGTGCAGWNAADLLYENGVTDVLVITEGINKGTSRNTGSDKQTYYKLSLSGDEGDSVGEMAKSLASDGADRDTALIQAACSVSSFMRLCALGVPFPQNDFGEYVGYRTDHDVRARATSAGPLTSKMMTEALERSALSKGVEVLDDTFVCEILTDEHGVCGVQVMDINTGDIRVIGCANAVVCTGGAALAYRDSVYPESQSGSMGLLLRAGARLVNMDIWQYGLASVKFRWNVSGSYQQVLPKFYSEDAEGNRYSFLEGTDLNLCFLKGYEWPFDIKKINGSSQIDLLVLNETRRGRRVFMDFRENPEGFAFDKLNNETLSYLRASGSMQDTPIERLCAMNAPAIELYKNHGIDLWSEPLEVKVCAQHINGGAEVDTDWQTCINGLYVAGEAAGTFGKTRPGGSALNATQVGSMRAARHISREKRTACDAQLSPKTIKLPEIREYEALRGLMSDYAAISRDTEKLTEIAKLAQSALKNGTTTDCVPIDERIMRLHAREAIYAQLAAVVSMLSRNKSNVLCAELDGDCIICSEREERPVLGRELWFETVWKKARGE